MTFSTTEARSTLISTRCFKKHLHRKSRRLQRESSGKIFPAANNQGSCVRLRFSSENISTNFFSTEPAALPSRKNEKSRTNVPDLAPDLIYLSYEQFFLFVRAVFSRSRLVYRDCQTVSIPSPCGAPARSIKQIERNNCGTYNLIHCAEWYSAELAFPFSRFTRQRGRQNEITLIDTFSFFFPLSR